MECSFYFHLVIVLLLFSSSSSSLILLSLGTHSMAVAQSSSSGMRRCHDDEMAALLQFKHAFYSTNHCRGDWHYVHPKPKLESWEEEGGDCCSWEGVECDEQTDHVIGLDLSDSCLCRSMNSSCSSSLFSLVSNITTLVSLDLSNNDLKGEFPAAIFDLPNLEKLDLRYNPDLEGNLPDFRVGSPLKSLLLSRTSFGGVVPPSIGNLARLEEIEICNCNFTGTFPVSFGDIISQWDVLDSSYIWEGNHFTLTTSSLSWIGNLTNLTNLNLRNMNLKGEIPSWLMNLAQLTWLAMDDNQLTGTIPSWLMTLPRLRHIDLSYNQLTGQIPSGFNPQIDSLDLSFNNLRGFIPKNLSTLYNLRFFSLERNGLVGSADLNLFCHLKHLFHLTLSYNKLSLSVKNISNKNATCFPSLWSLRLAACNLSEFPAFLHNNTNTMLEELDLSHNNLRGQTPSWIFDLGQDVDHGLLLYLSHNHLTGFEPNHSVFLPWKKIQTLDLRNNMLQGSLPIPQPSSSSGFLSYLVSNNDLSGQVSNLICNFTSLEYLDLAFNNLSGKLPPCLSNLSDSLLILELRENKFDGNIPSTWRSGCQLRMISMSHNQLEGELPRSLANCSSLEFVDFGNNKITDAFPFWLGRITTLSVLILRSNRFHGAINDDYGFSNLRVIDLSYNNFSGKIPSKLIDTSNPMRALVTSRTVEYMMQNLNAHTGWEHAMLRQDVSQFHYSMTMHNKGSELNYPKISYIFCAIDFSCNNFEGRIPDAFGDLTGVQLLNLSRNHLTGHIPSSFSNMKNLECLDLSQNQLSGQIPTELTDLPLSSFDVSFNNLSGPVPQGKQFCTFESASFEGNPGLFAEPWNKLCGNARSSLPQLQQPPSPTGEDGDDDDDSKIKWMIISVGFASGLVVGVILGNELIARKQYWFVKTFARIGIQ